MSIEYLIGPLDQQPPDFKLNIVELKAQLLKHWPHACVSMFDATESSGFSWTVNIDNYTVAGEFLDDKQKLGSVDV